MLPIRLFTSPDWWGVGWGGLLGDGDLNAAQRCCLNLERLN